MSEDLQEKVVREQVDGHPLVVFGEAAGTAMRVCGEGARWGMHHGDGLRRGSGTGTIEGGGSKERGGEGVGGEDECGAGCAQCPHAQV